MSITKPAVGATLLAVLSLFLFASVAEAKDTDGDGLSDKREKRLKTNPRKADTDRDALRDGREVKRTRTNPRKADTDGDGLKDGREVSDGLDPRDPDSDDDGTRDIYERKGRIEAITYTEDEVRITVRTKRNTIFQVRIDERTFLEGLDRDGDSLLTLSDFQVGDRVEVNLDPTNPTRAQTLELHIDDDEDNEWKGRITAIVASEVTVANPAGITRTFVVDIDTFLRAPDRDADGSLTINDLLVGDRVEAHLNEAGDKALSLEVEYNDDYEDGHDGYEDDDSEEAEGRLLPGFTDQELTITKRGYERTVLLNTETEFFGVDRNLDGERNTGDLVPGDKIKTRLAPDGETALAIEYKLPGEDEYHGGEKREIKGFILSKEPFVIQGVAGPLTLLPNGETEYDVSDRNSDSQENLADFQIGDFVEAKFRTSDNALLELELKGPSGPPDDDD